MLKVNTQRQITLPLELCEEVHLKVGDEIETFVYQEQITLVKKITGAAKGILQHIDVDKRFSDEQSLQGALDARL